MDSFYSTSNLTIRDFQNLDMKSLSLSTSILYRLVIVLWKRDTNSLAFIASLYNTKCVVFPFLSIVTNILSNLSFDPSILEMGNLTIKSMDIDD